MVEDPNKEDAIAAVLIRNNFYRKKTHFSLGVFFLAFLVIILLLIMLIFIIKHPRHPLYFVADDVGRLIQEVPVTEPNMTTDQVASWLIEAVQAAYSYDYLNYRAELQGAQKYFTNYGWYQYMKGLETSNNLLALTQRKYIIVAKVIGLPKLIVKGRVGAAYAWKFQLMVLATYLMPPFDEKSKFSNNLLVTAIVQRRSLLESYKGLGIHQLIAELITTTQTNTLVTPPS